MRPPSASSGRAESNAFEPGPLPPWILTLCHDLSELVLALPDLREDLPLRPPLHAEAFLDRRNVRAQEGIGLQLQTDGGGERCVAGGAHLIHLRGALLQGGAV